MITDFKKVYESEGFEPFVKYDVDKWIGGKRCQYHISGIMVLDGNTLCLWYKEFYSASWGESIQQYDGVNSTITFDDRPLIWADTKEEMVNDRKYLLEQEKAKDSHEINQCISLFKSFAKAYNDMDWTLQRKVEGTIRDSDDGAIKSVRNGLYRFMPDDDTEITEDDQYEMSRIFLTRHVDFRDSDGIRTRLNVDHAMTVCRCQMDNKNAVCITMADGNEYYIYEKNDSDVYKSLCVLYGI